LDEVLLDNIAFDIDVPHLIERLRVAPESEDAARIRAFAAEALAVGKPKGLYRVAFIDERGDDFVILGGVKLTSRILKANLSSAHRAFPYLVTCGKELEDWSAEFTDVFDRFIADSIKEIALRAGLAALMEHMSTHANPGPTASMNPGSLKDWPINEQARLFELLGDTSEKIGVRLTDSYLMMPVKSVSGIWFPTESKFENCQLCMRENCPNRRVPYNRELYNKHYGD
jgi:hypothetical protein